MTARDAADRAAHDAARARPVRGSRAVTNADNAGTMIPFPAG
jgi:hypothetical protein